MPRSKMSVFEQIRIRSAGRAHFEQTRRNNRAISIRLGRKRAACRGSKDEGQLEGTKQCLRLICTFSSSALCILHLLGICANSWRAGLYLTYYKATLL